MAQEFQRRQFPFLHLGMNWNSPAEKLQDGQIQWGKNIRVIEQGSVSSAHGYTLAYSLPPRGPETKNYINSMSRLNILNEQTVANINAGGALIPAFDQQLGRTYVMVSDDRLYVFQDQTTLSNGAINPVITPIVVQDQTIDFSTFSGNPVTMVDMQPTGAVVAWKYIGDSRCMVTVGYYPSGPDASNIQQNADQYDVTMARALTIGMDPPNSNMQPQSNPPGVNPIIGTPGNLNGQYQWSFVFRRLMTGARSNPSAATRASSGVPALTVTNASVYMTLPVTPIDPQTGQPDTHIVVDVYRFGGIIQRWALVGTGKSGDIFNDNNADINLLAAPAPSQITDASTGLTRFNLYKPFVTQDVARQGRAIIFVDILNYGGPQPGPPANIFHVQVQDNNFFNTAWLPGSTIFLTPDNGSQQAYTIYQVISGADLELTGDQSLSLVDGNFVDWVVQAGTLQSGQPLPHLWGPYGIGQSGSYIFACGDPNARGTLYWTNGNDPDSTDLVNNIIVTSPSEKLVTGCVYDGQPYCWSTERQFSIFPSLTIFGQFTTQEVAGAKGCWLEWSLSVQSNGFSDQSVTWRGKDGIYDFSNTGGLTRLSDPLYPFFPHDGAPGIAPETLITQISAVALHPEHVGNIDDTLPQYHRTCWFQGVLFYDFIALAEQNGVQYASYSTLVYDTINIPNGGWVCVDQPFTINGQPNTLSPIARFVEIGANDPNTPDVMNGPTYGAMARGGNMKIMYSGQTATLQNGYIFDYYGFSRNGFNSRLITKANDLGDSRQPKLFGDYWFDATPISNIKVTPLVRLNDQPLIFSELVPVHPPGEPEIFNRTQYTLDFIEFTDAGGRGLLQPSLGMDVSWTASDGQFAETIWQWATTFIPKPEFIEFRATDPNDAGAVQAKYLMGANIEANTENLPILVNVIIDQNVVASLTMQHDYQSIKPYAWAPVAGYDFQVQLVFDPDQLRGFQLFQVNWIFEVWPDAVARKYPFMSYGETGAKFIQGIVMPIETGGQPAKIGLFFDDANTQITWTKQTQPLVKTGVVFDLAEPIVAHEIQWQTFPQPNPNAPQLTPPITNPVGDFSIDAGPGARIWPQEAKVVWEPMPELTETWQTQPGNWDFCLWWSLREAYIAYMGPPATLDGQPPISPVAPTLHIETEYGTKDYLLPAPTSANQYIRAYIVLAPQKSKWKSFRVDAPAPGIRLFQKDCCVFAKEWGSDGPYQALHPFGDTSRTRGAAI
jgi:hypothetical protein